MKQLIICIIFLSLISCQDATPTTTSTTSFKLLNIDQAKTHITTDSVDLYFDAVRPLEMKILLRDSSQVWDREKLLTRYYQLLRNDLRNFTDEEAHHVQQIFAKALAKHHTVFPNISLPHISLLKTNGSYYGPGVYFTRQNDIIIPADAIDRLVSGDSSSFERVMLHEIFHILSRNHVNLKKKIYSLLGFEPIPALTLSPFLDKRVLFNPDGIDIQYAIQLKDSVGVSKKYAPIIYSKFGDFNPKNGPFFNHLIFQLFEISDDGAILSDDVGVDPNGFDAFWEKITRNTGYIIHPDELAADNYVYIIYWKSELDPSIDRFSDRGQELLQKMYRTLSGQSAATN